MSSKPIPSILRSLLFSYIATGILLLALSFLLYKLHLRSGQVSAAVHIIYAITCFFGGYLAGKSVNHRRFFWGLVVGLCYFLILFAMSSLMNRGATAETSQILLILAICAGGGTIGGMAS